MLYFHLQRITAPILATHRPHRYLLRRRSSGQGYTSSLFSITLWNSCGRGNGWIITGRLIPQNYFIFSENWKACCDIGEIYCSANCVHYSILTENSRIWYKFRLCSYTLILNQVQPTNQGEIFLDFSTFCSEGDNKREWSFLWKSWQIFFHVKDFHCQFYSEITNTWVMKRIPSFKYFQVIICLCMLPCLN